MSFSDKVVLVTGASRGIGAAIAHAFAQKGAIVVGTATSSAGADKITQAIQATGNRGVGLVLDVCNADHIEQLLKHVQEQFGAVAILVNNAGITEDNLILRMRSEQWDHVIDTDLNSVYRTTKGCLRAMMKARWGRVINITSVVGITGNPGQANYCAAKAGVIGFTKSVAIEMAGVGITVNAVAPGFIQTDMTDALNEKQQAAIMSQIPAKKLGKPVDIAHVALFLASDEAAYITGQTLHVNGGMYMA